MDDEVLVSGNHQAPRFSRVSSQLGRGGHTVITISRTSRDFTADEDLERGCLHASTHELAVPLLAADQAEEGAPSNSQADAAELNNSKVRFAVNSSLTVNIVLLVAKAWAYYISHSKAVLAR